MRVGRAQLATIWLALAGCTGGKYVEESTVESPPTVPFARPTQVTAGNESNFSPDLSPNGQYVVYTSDRLGNKDIWEKRASGGFGRQLTSHTADDFSPVISPDGRKIAFVSRREDAAGDIHILTLGSTLGSVFGDGEGDIVAISHKLTEDQNPAWFPESDKVVFAARKPGETTPALMLAEIKDLKALPLGEVHGDQPAVSPDGKRVAYVREGALYLYDMNEERELRLTAGGALQDGQPRFSPDGRFLVFIRYADDTNQDGKLDADDRPTIWRLEVETQLAAQEKESFALMPLTSAAFAAYSPRLAPPYLYFTLQTQDSLDIFRLPEGGQTAAPASLEEMRAQFDGLADPHERTYLLRRAQHAFFVDGRKQEAAEAALAELRWIVQENRATEARWLFAKIAANFADDAEIQALARLEMVVLELAPVAYPGYTGDLSASMAGLLERLRRRVETVLEAKGNSPRVTGQALLTKARILAAERRFFDANELLAKVRSDYQQVPGLAADAALYEAVIAPATTDVPTAVNRLIQVVRTYRDNGNVVDQASAAAVALVSPRGVEELVQLRTAARGLPVLPARAHMEIAALYRRAKKEAVTANELREVVDSYPESPRVILEAAAELSKLEETAGRYEAAEAMLKRLVATLETAAPLYREAARDLLVRFELRRGESLLRAGNAAEAASEYEKVLEVDPLNVAAHRGRIDAYYRLGRLSELVETYEKEAVDNPESAEHQYILGYAETYAIDDAGSAGARLGAIDRAIAQVELARQLNGQILQVHQTLGWLYLQKGYWQQVYYRQGSVLADLKKRWGLVRDFFGFGDPNWLELAIDSFLAAYYLAEEGSLEQAWLAQNLGQTFYELKNYQKSLNYYMRRIRLLELIPTRDQKVEALLWRRAGRAAFMTDELLLAETLQRRALTVWEAANSEEDVAYSLDALALTLRQRGKYAEAIQVYERLLEIHRRLGPPENLVGTLTNLGYAAFMAKRHDQALAYFDEAEKEVVKLTSTTAKESEQIQLGVVQAEAEDLDPLARHVMIVTFRGKVYEALGRTDLTIATYEKKLELLERRRAWLIEEKDASDEVLAEDIAILRNNLAQLKLGRGLHDDARKAFAAAQTEARSMRPEDQPYMTEAEWLNFVSYCRVQLRLAKLGLLSPDEIEATARNLDEAAKQFEASYGNGARAEGRALAESLALAAGIKALAPKTEGERLEEELERSLSLMTEVGGEKKTRAGALLTYEAVAQEPKKSDLLRRLLTEFRRSALSDPGLEWKYHAGRGRHAKAFEVLDRYVASGGTLASPSDRLAARQVFERLLEEDEVASDDEARESHLRRYLLLRLRELMGRVYAGGPLPKTIEPLLAMQSNEKIAEALGERDGILLVYRTLDGKVLAVLRRGEEARVAYAPGGKGSDPATALSHALSVLAPHLPENDGRLYVVPGPGLYSLPWAEIKVADDTLGKRYAFAFLPSPDLLPHFHANRRLPKLALGHVNGKGKADQNLAPGFDYRLAKGTGVVTTAFKRFDVVHVDTTLLLNDVEPGLSLVMAADTPDHRRDAPLKALPSESLRQTSLITFARVHGEADGLKASGEGEDGWVFLTLAAGAAGVPSVLIGEGDESNWQAFYAAFQVKPLSDAVRESGIAARILGHAGIPADQEEEWANEQVEEVLSLGEDLEDEGQWQEAAAAYRAKLYYDKRLGNDSDFFETLGRLVTVNFRALDYEEALHYQKRKILHVKKAREEQGDDADWDAMDYASMLMDGAALAVRSERFDEAFAFLDDAEKIYEEEDDQEALGKVYHQRGIALEHQKKYAETIAAFQKSRELSAEDAPLAAAARMQDIGTIYRNNLSDFTQALESYEQAEKEFRELNDQASLLRVWIDKSNVLMDLGETSTAIRLLENQVLPSISKEKDSRGWGRAADFLANAYYRSGDYQKAREMNDRTFEVLKDIQRPEQQAELEIDARNQRAMILANLGQFEEATQEFQAAAKIAREFKMRGKMALIYNNYGFWSREYGDLDRSIALFDEALRIDRELDSKRAIAFDLRNLGLSVMAKGDFNRAKSLLADALAMSEELGLAYNAAYCHFGLGDMAMREKRWDDAVTNFEKAFAISREGAMQDLIWRAKAGRATAAMGRGDHQTAAKEFGEATAILEKLRAGLKSEASRNAFQADRGVQETYQDYVKSLMELGRAEEAWTVAERSRARAFIDSLGNQKIRFAKTESVALLEEEQAQKTAIERLERLLERTKDGPRRTRAKERLAEARKAYQELLGRIEALDRRIAQFVVVETITKEELANLLPADTALVSYLVTRDALYVWVVQAGDVHGVRVDVTREALEKRIADFRTLMQNFSTPDYLGRELAQILITPILPHLSSAKRLAIVPHESLHFFPFAALPIEDRFLVDRFALYYLDAATLARYTHKAHEGRPGLSRSARILALANPQIPETNYQDLPFAEREAEAIGRYFPAVQVVRGSEASERFLKSEGGRFDVLHVASHGEFRPRVASRSRLLLAEGGGEDGSLTVPEIFEMQVQADMVTLSACESGLGEISSGDEIIGMNRAFIYAGANTVVSSLWRISDVASAVVMKRFYRYLAEGSDKAEALRRAQIVARRYFKHPAYWSSYRVLGSYE